MLIDGFHVDIPEDEARAIVASADIRIDEGDIWPKIYYNGEWMVLARTDLKDDVCTLGAFSSCSMLRLRSADQIRAKVAAAKRIYGARIHINPDHSTFALIDQWSDG